MRTPTGGGADDGKAPAVEAPVVGAPVVEVRSLRVTLDESGSDILDEVSFEIRPGEVLGVVGESGCGKTTLGLALLGYVRSGARISSGDVLVDGFDVAGTTGGRAEALRGGVVAYVPQDPPSALNPVLRIGRQLREVLDAHAPEWPEEVKQARYREVLSEVLLPSDTDFSRRYPHQLSGGQQQRLMIAMAVACRPKVLVCDEPTTGLDTTIQARVLETLRQLCRDHRIAVLYISHDLAVVGSLADRIAVMYAGRIVETGPRRELFSNPRHPYTRGLLRALPSISERRALIGIPGRAPEPGRRPTGCSFSGTSRAVLPRRACGGGPERRRRSEGADGRASGADVGAAHGVLRNPDGPQRGQLRSPEPGVSRPRG